MPKMSVANYTEIMQIMYTTNGDLKTYRQHMWLLAKIAIVAVITDNMEQNA